MNDGPNPFVDVERELPRVMTAQQVADFLQFPVSTVQGLARRSEIPSFMLGKHRRFLRGDLERCIRERTAAGGEHPKAA